MSRLRTALLVAGALAIGCGAVDPCAGKSGSCLAIDVQSEVAAIDAVKIDLAGALTYTNTLSLAGKSFPIAVAILLPDGAAGALTISGSGLQGGPSGQTIALGTTTATLTAGGHATAVLRLAAGAPRVGCADGVKNGDESDRDCGGSCMTKCGDGKACKVAGDCAGGLCAMGLCATPTKPNCMDAIKNGDESDVDCGGSCITKCADGKTCAAPTDCMGGLCTLGLCATLVKPNCMDQIKNGDESDVDCGGSCMTRCGEGQTCLASGDCAGGSCVGGKCVTPGCSNNLKDASETDIDCGGTCAPCSDGKGCAKSLDCASGVCLMFQCAAPSCMDTVKNGDESDTDCGGACPKNCDNGKKCGKADDCASSVCGGGKCLAPTCMDLVANGVETDVDCGGAMCASRCADLSAGLLNSDCKSGVCSAKTCVTASCNDQMKNGSETDIDCGGPKCAKCGEGKSCGVAVDCVNNACFKNRCALPPVLTVIAPSSGPSLGGIALVIAGQNFALGMGLQLTFQNVPAQNLKMVSPIQLTCTLPAVPTFSGQTNVLFTNPDGQTALAGNLFSYFLTKLSFGAPLDYKAPMSPFGLETADLNGDKKPDLVLAASDGSGVAVYLGQGNGQFTPLAPITVQSAAQTATADLNGDGKLDVAVTSFFGPDASNVSVLLGKGDGTFAPTATYSAGTMANPSGIVVGDFTGDKIPDLATANVAGGGAGAGVSVLPGKGGGTFTTAIRTNVGTQDYGLVAGDWNGDGTLDVALTSYTDGSVYALLGRGDGTFLVASGNKTNVGATLITTGDYNSDGRADLAAVNVKQPSFLSVLLGKGDGTYQPAVNYGGLSGSVGVVSADINGDGKMDLVASNGEGMINTLTVFLNSGAGQFPSTLTVPTGMNGVDPYGIAAGDWNGDGRIDLASANYRGASLTVLLNTSQ
ncbi:MAG: hypothetical protein EXR72_12525 [Myxococcales bacterium]|nr:hypothetical protein [Myxococcales bacterium]